MVGSCLIGHAPRRVPNSFVAAHGKADGDSPSVSVVMAADTIATVAAFLCPLSYEEAARATAAPLLAIPPLLRHLGGGIVYMPKRQRQHGDPRRQHHRLREQQPADFEPEH
jgi:hypothetical protein